MKKFSLILIAVILLSFTGLAQQYEESAAITFIVLKDLSGKPVRNASVIMHPVKKNGDQERGGLQLKSDGDGRCYFDGVPYGKLRIQVLATGFQTFGQDYDVSEPKMTVTIRLKRPQGQYSIYTDQQNDKKDDAPETKKTDKPESKPESKPEDQKPAPDAPPQK